MSIILIPFDHKAAASGLASGMGAFERRFGRWWPVVWIACGLVALAGGALFAAVFMPELGAALAVGEVFPWILCGIVALIMIASGPFAIACVALLFVVWVLLFFFLA